MMEVISLLLYGKIETTKVNLKVCNPRLGVIGVKWCPLNRKIYQVHPGPAFEAGIKEGDEIIEVENNEGTHEITGPEGSIVCVTIRRENLIKTYTLTRVDYRTIKESKYYYEKK